MGSLAGWEVRKKDGRIEELDRQHAEKLGVVRDGLGGHLIEDEFDNAVPLAGEAGIVKHHAACLQEVSLDDEVLRLVLCDCALWTLDIHKYLGEDLQAFLLL